ncbi:UvrD-helicase domain-containing protein [Streptococcus vestibularis]|uniref:UvrD-helicase domain-containing protein n=1 Tax=Streptococcus vestibularis TaxID=1343 RepID=UPI000E4379FE|nr:UvrD-helicase domain-containing protein [Streptococcus vestibularis]RGM54728.1 ATP-dependent helicase [Streptococcus vestibularis]
MEISDQKIRNDILNYNGSLVVRASAGSGKTTIMVKKIKKVLGEIKDHKTVAATTFTRKATQEIRKKYRELGGEKTFLVTTNDSFVEQEIIRPFINDAHRTQEVKWDEVDLRGLNISNYNFSLLDLSDFSNSYDGKDSKATYGLLLKELIDNHILAKYFDNKKNFKFELALFILKNSKACREYLKYKYKMIFIDEYQDSDSMMHELFMYLNSELGIDVFIVGDVKQAIYLWRGAKEDIFDKIPTNIEQKELWYNFRSHFEIVNYAAVIHEPKAIDNKSGQTSGHVKIVDLGVSGLGKILKSPLVDLNMEITIIIRTNQEAQELKDELLDNYNLNFEFIPSTPLDQNQSENTFILRLIAKRFYDKTFSIFDFVEECGLEIRKSKIEELNRTFNELINLFNFSISEEFNLDLFTKIIQDISVQLEVLFSESELMLLKETLSNHTFREAFVPSKNKHKIMTIFSAKGLEFEQVIGFGKDYNLEDTNQRNNHYVLVTRAKDKLILINGENYLEQVDAKISKNSESTSDFFYQHSYFQ